MADVENARQAMLDLVSANESDTAPEKATGLRLEALTLAVLAVAEQLHGIHEQLKTRNSVD